METLTVKILLTAMVTLLASFVVLKLFGSESTSMWLLIFILAAFFISLAVTLVCAIIVIWI